MRRRAEGALLTRSGLSKHYNGCRKSSMYFTGISNIQLMSDGYRSKKRSYCQDKDGPLAKSVLATKFTLLGYPRPTYTVVDRSNGFQVKVDLPNNTSFTSKYVHRLIHFCLIQTLAVVLDMPPKNWLNTRQHILHWRIQGRCTNIQLQRRQYKVLHSWREAKSTYTRIQAFLS